MSRLVALDDVDVGQESDKDAQMLFLRDSKGQRIGDWLWEVVCVKRRLSKNVPKEGEPASMSRE